MNDERELRVQLCRMGASLFNRGLTHGRTGNLSVRIDDRILLTPTGGSLGDLDPDNLAIINLAGEHIGGAKPSKEAFLHAAFYRARPDDRAVAHTHSTHSVAVSCLADVDPADVLPPLTAYYAMRVGHLPLVPYHAPGDDSLRDLAERLAADHHAILIANHGPVIGGKDLPTAVDAIEELEETAKLALLLHGREIKPLTDEQAEALRR
ncbi:3-oxo-tetronate 4-phosphate decarboxylase [Propionimicrobium sp. PCR01-08-3]|uniref:3-oxo-tetronate 4-phosphate decarboxylase n=1 Tax=Propionimicrobium sp. PCR01-08-3 TaxID=3052086 RepID=UPI00255C6327|nr:3-oxo-tetronate 4-phosphate decarboxylase [Propionimicrobium sp. PCR01-08-3]WIY81891.1 aldolase [Propionimicrobium sp. PCR01-08-3]